MINDNTKTGERGYAGKAFRDDENSQSISADSAAGKPPSADFRETLLKSGLDVSAYEIDEPEKINLPIDKSLSFSSSDFSKDQRKNAPEVFTPSSETPEIGKKKFQPFRRWQHFAAAAGIAVVIILQSVFQFSFIRDENLRASENLIEAASPAGKSVREKAPVEIPETETSEVYETNEQAKTDVRVENKIPKAPSAPKKVAVKIQREARQIPARTALRKKEPRETNAERLRRVEKILTGA